MNCYFSELGRRVYGRWLDADFSLAAFPEIARTALEEQPPSEQVDLTDLIREFLLSDEQPYQSASGFGQPEIIVYDSPKFYIQLLFWLDGTTDIHQHEFSGAFHVMAGSSIHSEYAFENAQDVTAHFRIGNLKLRKADLLETGRTVPITSGRTGMHALFHLETPSVTVVVRTHSDPGTGPQFTYLPPHLAVDPVQSDALTLRRKQLLDVLEQTGDPDYAPLVLEMITNLDFERGFFILQNCIGPLRLLGSWEDVWRVFERKHRKLAAPVLPTLEEIIRRDGLVALRSSIEEAEHRFYLALILNLENRTDLLKMVGKRFPGDPVDTVLRWAGELIQFADSGIWILDAQFPEEIETDEEDKPLLYLTALAHFMTGGTIPKELKPLGKKNLALLRQSFQKSSWRVLLAD
ncbi:MAG: hypothetical protein WCP60_09635 [bacterium]